MTRMMWFEMVFFIAFGSLSGIGWREWAKSEVRQAQAELLISMPVEALQQITVDI